MAIPSIATYPMPTVNDFPKGKVDWQLDPKRAVFLIHDMQDYFLRFYDQGSDLIQTLKQNLVDIKAFCHQQGIPVVYTAQPNGQAPEDRALLNDMWGSGLNDYPELQPVISELTPSEIDTVLVKWRYSAFHRSNLQELMQGWGRDQLIIGGIYAHIGCMISAADAFMRDIQPFMVGDALADFSEDEHKMALSYTAGRTGRVVSTEDVLLSAKHSEGATSEEPSMTFDLLKAQVLELIDEDDLSEFESDDELIDYGLDSIQIMSFVTKWRTLGVEVTFAELVQAASLNGWWALIERKQQKVAN
ncbi:isochorismatase family protein [Marinomonas mediterranea]|uniref:isochorismatase family protein n=1 Tax=Marinomonas mediterranea TaxID=119864 RepID=UPI00234A52AE|nr:isochorismatase [Marinomonas mediterranea]WCN14063.1 isochorismatase family protein [Marinomonas mediterranea]